MAVHPAKIFDSLQQILEKSPHTRIFIAWRLHIRAGIEKRLGGRVINVFVGLQKDYIRDLGLKLSEDENPDAMDESLEADILDMIPKSMSGMYLEE